MHEAERPLSPHLQIYRWQITMLLSILHRATGVLLACGIVVLIAWLASAAAGPEPYTRVKDILVSWPGTVVVVAITFAFSFHLLNGVRHLFWDAGMGFEKPQYRASGWSVVIGSVLLTTLLVVIGSGVVGGGA